MRRVFHRVQVIQVAEEFVEAVNGGQELVAVAQMVLAELAGGVALRFERGGNRASFGREADLGTRLADRGHAGANRQLAGDEVRATRRAAGLGVVVGEQHAFLGHLVEVRRPPGHQAAVVGADVPHADVVAHDEEDVRLLAVLLLGLGDGFLHPRIGHRQQLGLVRPIATAAGTVALLASSCRSVGSRPSGRGGLCFLEWVELARRGAVTDGRAGDKHEQHLNSRTPEHRNFSCCESSLPGRNDSAPKN